MAESQVPIALRQSGIEFLEMQFDLIRDGLPRGGGVVLLAEMMFNQFEPVLGFKLFFLGEVD